VLVLPWFVAIVMRAGDTFFAESVGQDMLAKVYSGQESHGAPPGYYFALFWFTFWPGAVLAGLAAPAIWGARREPGARFLLAWLLPSWIVFELVITKLPHYVLPLYPAIAILLVGVVERQTLSRAGWMTHGTAWWFAVPVIVCVAGIGGLIAISLQPAFLAWPFAAGAAIAGLLAWQLYDADGAERSVLRAVAASILMSICIYAVVIPSLGALFPSPALARALRDSRCPQGAPAAAAGYHEPSLVLLAGTSIRLTDGVGAADFLNEGPCRVAMVEARQERGFIRRAEAIGLRYAPGQRVEGINISSGRKISIAFYRSEVVP
jgi:4-amino-4-deoxy-L-arabinose transferase-like glycosyltransferase